MKKQFSAILVICLAVGGCFGGGGGGGGPQTLGPQTPTVPQLPNRPATPIVASPNPAERASISTLETFYAGYLSDSVAGGEFDLVNLDRAYANIYSANGATAAGRPGNGVTIGFIDSGLDTQHSAFQGKSMRVEYFGGASAGSDLVGANASSHGTAVAGIAAGVRVDWPELFVDQVTGTFVPVTSEGVAPGANIRMFVDGDDNDGLDVTFQAIAAALNLARGVDILNLSIGLSGEEGIISDTEYAGANASDFEAQDQIQAGRTEKTLLVWAAGNENNDMNQPCTPNKPGFESCQANGTLAATSPGPLAGAMYRIPELRPHSVAVVAVKQDGTIADFSNRCGVAADWCIAAPGEDIGTARSKRESDGRTLTRDVGDDVAFEESLGTSLAAPIVAGGLALMKQRFRSQLSNVQLLARMLATADKTGRYSNSAIYGQGLLDLGAATEPVRTVGTVASGAGFVNEESIRQFAPLSGTNIETAEAFGDGIARAFAGREIAGFDSLGAPFWYPLEAFALKTEKPLVREQLLGFMDFSTHGDAKEKGGVSATGGQISAPLFADENGQGKGFGVTDGEQIPSVYVSMGRGKIKESDRLNKSGHLSFIENPVSFGVESDNFAVSAFTSDEREERGARGAVVSYRLPNLPFGFRSGYISESNSTLGSTAEGAFGGVSASTVFASVGWDYEAGNWQIVADAEMGVAAPETEAGLINSVSQLRTSSFSAGVIRKFSGGSAIRVSVSSPLRIESGRMGLSIPTGRTPEGAILRETVTANLEPSGRQIDFSAQVVAQTKAGKVSIGTVASREPGHDENANTALSLLAGYSMSF
ncbi:MAG: S8 family serine peptidase [Candidatus Dadabacteria bacterium]|nr:S8 family serine peptidase [Candidatus Dadabacteria bacterium]